MSDKADFDPEHDRFFTRLYRRRQGWSYQEICVRLEDDLEQTQAQVNVLRSHNKMLEFKVRALELSLKEARRPRTIEVSNGGLSGKSTWKSWIRSAFAWRGWNIFR